MSPVESARNTSPSANSGRSNSVSRSHSAVTPPLIPQSTSESAAYSAFSSNAAPVTVGGSVFGWSTTVVTPPAAALRDPVAHVSLCPYPGWRKCTCASIIPGSKRFPVASTSVSPSRSSPTASMRPSVMRTSRSSPSGSVAFRITRIL